MIGKTHELRIYIVAEEKLNDLSVPELNDLSVLWWRKRD